jgi:hypothetical protein
MRINSLTNISVANQVWSTTTRALTNAGFVTTSGQVHTTLAAGSNVDLTANGGVYGLIFIALSAGAAGNCTIGLNDGVVVYVVTTAASGQTAGGFAPMSGSVGCRIKNNDGANACSYMYTYQAVLT